MICYSKFKNGKRSVVVAGCTPADAALLRDALLLVGDSKFYVLEDSSDA